MAIYEFYCKPCRRSFELIISARDPEMGRCPKCGGRDTERKISRFFVGGRGDLRESTLHGCHDQGWMPGEEGDLRPHSHDHSGESDEE